MRSPGRCAALIALLLAAAGCRSSSAGRPAASRNDGAGLEARATRLTTALASADSGASRDKPVARWLMPPDLAEISGLALTPDGRLFAHDDESAVITQLDFRRGTVVKKFFVGRHGLKGDFEGLTYARDRFFLLRSDGTLYEFREGEAGEGVDYTEHDTRLGKQCEFEGVAYDSTLNALILPCKQVGTRGLRKMLVIYRYSLDGTGKAGVSQFTVPYAEAIGGNDWKQLHPTDITVDPFSGNYVLVAGPEQALIAITPAGKVVFSRPLSGRHPQAEGIAISRDGILIISDESVNAAAAITLYRWPPSPAS
ncbi:MAG: hypothetical protein ACYDIE_02420 [Candidatus Krumholzibacteriia bacterium]